MTPGLNSLPMTGLDNRHYVTPITIILCIIQLITIRHGGSIKYVLDYHIKLLYKVHEHLKANIVEKVIRQQAVLSTSNSPRMVPVPNFMTAKALCQTMCFRTTSCLKHYKTVSAEFTQ